MAKRYPVCSACFLGNCFVVAAYFCLQTSLTQKYPMAQENRKPPHRTKQQKLAQLSKGGMQLPIFNKTKKFYQSLTLLFFPVPSQVYSCPPMDSIFSGIWCQSVYLWKSSDACTCLTVSIGSLTLQVVLLKIDHKGLQVSLLLGGNDWKIGRVYLMPPYLHFLL